MPLCTTQYATLSVFPFLSINQSCLLLMLLHVSRAFDSSYHPHPTAIQHNIAHITAGLAVLHKQGNLLSIHADFGARAAAKWTMSTR